MPQELHMRCKKIRKNISFSIDNAGGAVTLRPR